MSKKKYRKDWVVYPDIDITIDELKTYINMKESINENLEIDEVKEIIEEEISGEVETLITEDESEELTEEEKHELFIKQLKESKIKFHPIKHDGNITTNQFNTAYRKKRQRKNNAQKASRRNSRG